MIRTRVVKRISAAVFVIAVLLAFVPAVEAVTPIHNDVELDFVGHYFIINPQKGFLSSAGLVSGDIDGFMVIWLHGLALTGMAEHFEQLWEIYDTGSFNFATGELHVGTLLMAGVHKGVISYANSKMHMHSTVMYAAPEYTQFLGRPENLQMDIVWVIPGELIGATFIGTQQIN